MASKNPTMRAIARKDTPGTFHVYVSHDIAQSYSRAVIPRANKTAGTAYPMSGVTNPKSITNTGMQPIDTDDHPFPTPLPEYQTVTRVAYAVA